MYVFSSLLRAESKCSCIILAVYILRGYRGGWIIENPLLKKEPTIQVKGSAKHILRSNVGATKIGNYEY